MYFLKHTILICTMLLLTACSTKTSKQIVADLWSGWEKAEVQMQTDYPDAVPLILVHGWNGGEGTWPAPYQLIALENRLHRDIYLFTYRTGVFSNRYPPLEVLEEQFNAYLKAYDKVDIVAHSMGGLLVRHYLSHHTSSPIRRVVFLATPHFGTNAARVLMRLGTIGSEGNIQATEIQPGSDFLWQLNALGGSELEGVDVLNIYVAEHSLLNSDFVVSPVSAHLPWVRNAIVEGMHHTLAQQLDKFEMIFEFVQHGTLPEGVQPPERKDAWFRFESEGVLLRLAENTFKVYDGKGHLSKKYNICCKIRSGLYDIAGKKTVVVEGLEPGMTYQYTSHRGAVPFRVSSDELMNSDQSVVMRLLKLKPESPAMPGMVPNQDIPED